MFQSTEGPWTPKNPLWLKPAQKKNINRGEIVSTAVSVGAFGVNSAFKPTRQRSTYSATTTTQSNSCSVEKHIWNCVTLTYWSAKEQNVSKSTGQKQTVWSSGSLRYKTPKKATKTLQSLCLLQNISLLWECPQNSSWLLTKFSF